METTTPLPPLPTLIPVRGQFFLVERPDHLGHLGPHLFHDHVGEHTTRSILLKAIREFNEDPDVPSVRPGEHMRIGGPYKPAEMPFKDAYAHDEDIDEAEAEPGRKRLWSSEKPDDD